MNKIAALFLATVLSFSLFSQTTINGNITDANTGEALIGATVIFGKGQGTATDFEGNYSFKIHEGERSLKVSYVGYKEINKTITVDKNSQNLNFKLTTVLLNEVQVVSDIARDRETPVAFSTIPMKKISEELASQDIPMVLNTTPGVYATQSGGGDGDARITIRGFNQRNVAVMIDGIPVNDMENGWVYWSNWFGLDAVTSNIQVQRGLGSSKIAIPSVGGTMNILTKGTGNKAGGTLKQSVGSYGKLRTSLGYNSGRLESGWGYTLAGSYKRGNGFVDETWSEGYFYYAKIQKEIGNHILSLSAMGAPQKHGQRSYKSDISTYWNRAQQAYKADSVNGIFKGMDYYHREALKYNKHWGYLDRWSLNNNGDTIHNRETLNTKQNYYHKPQFSLRDFWTVSDKFYISNILYASIGNGGGTSPSKTTYDTNGQHDLQNIYNANVGAGLFGPIRDLDWVPDSTQYKSGDYLKSSINNHYWYGGLSTLNYQVTEEISLSGGIDMRYYKGEHYREIYDLLGGDYAIVDDDATQFSRVKREGDIIGYHNDAIVKWSGAFSQAEYSNGMISAFFNISGSNSAYKRIDYFKKKDLVLTDTTIREALGTYVNYVNGSPTYALDVVTVNGVDYTVNSKEAKTASTDWKWIRGYTVKTGLNVNLDEYNNVFFNTGYISKAPRFANVFDNDNSMFKGIKNEIVKAVEGGYSYRSSLFSANLNTYYTVWENKPSKGITYKDKDENLIKGNINGMNALHKGFEVDLSYKISHKVSVEGLLSLGDWTWTSADTVRLYDENNNAILDENNNPVDTAFDAKGVHVGDAAQTQYGLSVRYEPTYNSYIKLRGTYFADYYSDFDPLSLHGENGGRESWVIPAYQLVDLHAGYKFKIFDDKKLDIKFSILNLLNEIYISDAQNNDPYNANTSDFDAKSAGVFFGLGRRFSLSARFNF
ncbi:TonB-dependent receptor [Flavobacteriales bacterium]|nr:TonB-dependent receptor [Flavobacteriales bacterium]MDC3395004.1 TonB-dependent receptor [Flavobacteriales bacterium]